MVQKALIDNQMVSCINVSGWNLDISFHEGGFSEINVSSSKVALVQVRPFMFNGDLMMTLGDLVGGLFPQQVWLVTRSWSLWSWLGWL